jgi:hypothetical protein
MAGFNHGGSTKTLPPNNSDSKRTYGPNTTEHSINQKKTSKTNKKKIWNHNKNPTTKQQTKPLPPWKKPGGYTPTKRDSFPSHQAMATDTC